MNIRKATIKDIDALIKLRLDLLLAVCGSLTTDEEIAIRSQLATYFVKHINHDFIAILAEIDNNVVSIAFLAISEMPANLEFITGKRGTLFNVFTYPEHRRMGFATKVLSLIIEDAKQFGVSAIDLDATQDGKPLYEKLGFTEPKSKQHIGMKLQLV